MADQLLQADRSRITVVHRRVDLAALRATSDVEPLKQVAREALQDHLERRPDDAAFITPQAIVSSPSATAEFYAKADQVKGAWCTLLKRTLGCGNVRRLRRASDQETWCLVLFGTLIEGRQLYLPGLWPNQPPRTKYLMRTPFQSRTVPPSFLA